MLYDVLWQSKHATQSYPLADESLGLSTINRQLPMSLLLDVRIIMPTLKLAQLFKNSFFISSIVDELYSITITIGVLYNNTQYNCLYAANIPKNILLGSTVLKHYFVLSPVLDLNTESIDFVKKLTGSIYIGLTAKYTQGSAVYNYTANSTRLNPMCVTHMGGLSSILVNGVQLSGVIKLKAGLGIVLDVDQANNTIKISADIDYITAQDDQLIQSQMLAQIASIVLLLKSGLGNPVKSINGILPDENGNITISGVDCVELNQAGAGTLTISDVCSKPCCTANYSDKLQPQIDMVKALHAILKDYFVHQANNINYIQSNLATLIGTM